MTVLQNYIYYYIFKLIILYIYKKPTITNFYFSNKYIFDNFNNNELISYSLVSKAIFNNISSLLLNEVLDFKNYKALIHLIEPPLKINNNNNNNNINNKTYKLISNKNSIIIFNSLNDFNNYKSLYKINNYKLILVKIQDYIESVNFLNTIQNYPSNCIFNIRIILKNDNFNNLNISKLNNGNQINCINKITIFSSSVVIQESKIFTNLINLNPKRIHYNHGPYGTRHLSIAPFFQTKSNTLESFKMSPYDHAEPEDLSKISTQYTPHLKALEITISYHDIIKFVNKISNLNQTKFCEPYYEYFDIKKIEKDWSLMISSLSNNKSINEILFCSHCVQDDCLKEYEFDSSMVYNGIETIINSPNTNIKVLGLGGHYDLDKSFFEALSINKTISTLYLSYCEEKIIIKYVLKKNKTIRNLIINSDYADKVIKQILKYSSHIELYSLSFHRCFVNNDFHKIMDIIKLNTFNIKEINFYGVDFKKYYNFKTRYYLNNTIVNIIFNKIDEDEEEEMELEYTESNEHEDDDDEEFESTSDT